jgi:Domain of unknown function (DUF309)
MIAPPLPPLRLRNQLADAILAALHDPEARRTLARVAWDDEVAGRWLAPDESVHLGVIRARAQHASAALAAAPLHSPSRNLQAALDAAALLFDAGLFFETHEVLEPHWRQASGETREALQGLIQIAVGYQHWVNRNAKGARTLLAEGVTRVTGRRLRGIGLDEFGEAVAEANRQAAGGVSPVVPPFPRFQRAP